MFHHMILMCSDFTTGKRIAFHKSYSKFTDAFKFKQEMKLIKEQFDTISFSFHYIETEKQDYMSVVEYDNYFLDVDFFDTKEAFISRVKESIKITPEDIAKYILTKGEFDKLQVLKLVFFAYSEYAKTHDKPLFEQDFEAWAYGPVIPKLYHELNKYGKIKLDDVDICKMQIEIKFSKNKQGKEVIECIDKTLEKYGDKDGGTMIDITHEKGSPWDIVKKTEGPNSIIPYKLIKEYVRS